MNIINKILATLKGFLSKSKPKDNINESKSNETPKTESESNKSDSNNSAESKKSPKQLFTEKIDKYLHSNISGTSIFEKVNDARSLFMLERTIHKNITYVAFFFFATTIVCLLLIMALFPLKEKEPYLVGFSDVTQNFVTIERADSTITSNESLVRSLIGAYIMQRETINHIDDKKRYQIVKAQSSSKVWNNFEAIVAQEKSIYTNNDLMREVEIINIAKWKDGYSNVDVVIRLYNTALGMSLESEKRYRIIIVYKFESQKITFENIPINPTGFKVIDYAITQIAVIKELDKNKRVGRDEMKSKIQDNKQGNQIDAYMYNDQNMQMQGNQNLMNGANYPQPQNNGYNGYNGQNPQNSQYPQNNSGNNNNQQTYRSVDEFMRNNPNIFPQNNQNGNMPNPYR